MTWKSWRWNRWPFWCGLDFRLQIMSNKLSEIFLAIYLHVYNVHVHCLLVFCSKQCISIQVPDTNEDNDAVHDFWIILTENLNTRYIIVVQMFTIHFTRANLWHWHIHFCRALWISSRFSMKCHTRCI